MHASDLPRWNVSGPLASRASGFAGYLAEQGYGRCGIRQHLHLMEQLSGWLAGRGIDAEGLTVSVVAEFADVMRVSRSYLVSPRALAPLLSYLRGGGAAPAVPLERTERGELLDAYRSHLVEDRGLAAGTVHNELRVARRFVAMLGDRLGDRLRELTAARVLEIVTDLVRCVGGRSRIGVASSARTLLRFLFVTSRVPTDLASVIPPVVSATSIGGRAGPKGRLDPGVVDVLLGSCDCAHEPGRRDYAILLVLVRLGLRAGEVAGLTLDDVDWVSGTITVRGKGGRRDVLSLLWDVGEAVAGYLQARPAAPGWRAVFVTARAPRRAMTRIGAVVAHACGRAQIGRCGPHRLRHAMASDLLTAGASLQEITAVLRHGQLQTTAIYATVEASALSALVRPWPAAEREAAW